MDEPRHSVTERGATGDARLFAPAAARNTGPIVEALVPHLPSSGLALEVASGTGEHVIALAAATPSLTWQTTEVDPERLASIAAWTAHAAAPNIHPPMEFDAVSSSWLGQPADAVFLANLLHLISEPDTSMLVTNLANALAPGGVLALYGPFKRGTAYASEGDERFDAAIQAERPLAGYKSIDWVDKQCETNGLTHVAQNAMPANNLLTLWQR